MRSGQTPRAAHRLLLAAGASICVVLRVHPALAQQADQTGPSPMPQSDTLLPQVGIDVSRPGFADTLRDDLNAQTTPVTGAAAAGPGFQLHPQITVSEEYTEHANQLGGIAGVSGLSVGGANSGADFVSLIQPELLASEVSERLVGSFDYRPTVDIFARHGNDDGVRQTFNGNAQFTALPGWLYIDARGVLTQQSVFGGIASDAGTALPANDRETLANGSITPYFARSFGEFGTAQLGGSYIYTGVNVPGSVTSTTIDSLGFAVPTNYGSSWLSTKRGFANFITGPVLERVQNEISVDSNFYDGSGELRGAHRLLVTDDISYAINRYVAAIGQVGYENTDYPQALYHYYGGVYALGVTLTPAGNANLTLEYRRSDGIGAPYAHGNWLITPRLRLFGTYSEGISSFNQQQQSDLLSGDTDETGAYASALLAAPISGFGQSGAGTQALQHRRQLNASLAYTLDRDVFTLQLGHSRSNVVGSPLGLPTSTLARYGLQGLTLAQILKLAATDPEFIAFLDFIGITPTTLRDAEKLTSGTSSFYNANLTWHHDLTPDLSSDLNVGYRKSDAAFTNIENTGSIFVSASLNKTFTETITGSIRYVGTYQLGGGSSSNDSYQNNNVFAVSLTKKF